MRILSVLFLAFAPGALFGACGFGSSIAGGKCRGFLTTTSSSSCSGSPTVFTLPTDWTATNTIEAIGSGAAGGAGSTGGSGGTGARGGGAGAYSVINNLNLSGNAGYCIPAANGVFGTIFCSDTSANCGWSFATNGSAVVLVACEGLSSGITGGPSSGACPDGNTTSLGGVSKGGDGGAAGGSGHTGGGGGGAAGINGAGNPGTGGNPGPGAGGTGDNGTTAAGANGTEWQTSPAFGSGGGGNGGVAAAGSDGGTYGAGGGGGQGNGHAGGLGKQGLIVVTYTPAPAAKPLPVVILQSVTRAAYWFIGLPEFWQPHPIAMFRMRSTREYVRRALRRLRAPDDERAAGRHVLAEIIDGQSSTMDLVNIPVFVDSHLG